MDYSTPRQDAKKPVRTDDPRDLSHSDERDVAAEGERAADGVPARIGCKAWYPSQCVEGYITGGTDQLCILTDPKTGLQHAERWGHVMTRASGLAEPTTTTTTTTTTATPSGASQATHAPTPPSAPALRDTPVLGFTPEQLDKLRNDPWHDIELRIKGLQAAVGRMRNESGRYDASQLHLLDLLRESAMQAGEIGDNIADDLVHAIAEQADAEHLADEGGAQ